MIIDLPLDQLRIPDNFTASERAVLMLVLEGLSNAEIAARRQRSERTIANQLASLYRPAAPLSNKTSLASS